MGRDKGTKRDDFLEGVKRDLAKRVNYNCSICGAQTAGPRTGSDKSFTVGKAAHIKAAAPGGPRYDPSQTPAERRSIGNGIWCCAICADIVDLDAAAYSVQKLLSLKSEAEQTARRRIGRPPTVPKAAAMTPSAILRAVAEFCHAESSYREKLDPRFKVAVELGSLGPIYHLRAVEPVAAELKIQAEVGQTKVLQDVFDYGGTAVVEDVHVHLDGSPLFEDINGVKRFEISSQSRRVHLTMTIPIESGPSLYLDFAGVATYGSKGIRFKGEALSGMFAAQFALGNQSQRTDFEFRFDVQQWAQLPLLRLPNFERLKEAVSTLSRATSVQLQLTGEGKGAEIASGTVDFGRQYLRGLYRFLLEVNSLRKLDGFFGLSLTMPADLDDILRDQGDVSDLLSLIDIHNATKQEITATLTPGEPANDLIDAIENQRPVDIRISQPTELRILGRTYGPFDLEVLCPSAVIVPVGPATISRGKATRFILRATNGHRWAARSA